MAHKESMGFFDNIPNKTWMLMKKRVQRRVNHYNLKNPMSFEKNIPAFFYQDNFEPDFGCQNELRVGGMGDGGKWTCYPDRIAALAAEKSKSKGEKCLIYSVGSGGDFRFEEGIAEILTAGKTQDQDLCEIHVFDPEDFSSNIPMKFKSFIHFHKWGFRGATASLNDMIFPAASYRTLEDTINDLGHVNRTIEVFKVDCEECEWGAYQDWLNAPLFMRQILVEVHYVPSNAIDFFTSLQSAGYVNFHKEPNMACGGDCVEYSFLKLDESFFEFPNIKQ
eukprot:CAMPEP_0195512526 /NCGR_PEP_ID=MMETSP0794_2-20130614/4453_1 /TAXON_ID=515487 /ORGANISM="Stephanopyxis turris, Strain CCMP 815" /LENGTH=277 /DNA_ID=CAMNT_0040640329 /DNA_START=149 /DNA_END=982 /DNA_ORIENTATION=+